jgi:transcriptional regulator with XRE-family HTH domain
MTKTIGQVIQEYRAKRHISLRNLADEVELSHSLISEIERGNAKPSYETLLILAKGLDIPKTVIKLPEL